jgi:hypothetical protein
LIQVAPRSAQQPARKAGRLADCVLQRSKFSLSAGPGNGGLDGLSTGNQPRLLKRGEPLRHERIGAALLELLDPGVRLRQLAAEAVDLGLEGPNSAGHCRLLGTYRAQPEAGHERMTIGIPAFRDPRELRLDRMLMQPLRDDASRGTAT